MKKPKAIPKDKLASLTPQQQEYLAELLWDYQWERLNNSRFKPNIYIDKLIRSLNEQN